MRNISSGAKHGQRRQGIAAAGALRQPARALRSWSPDDPGGVLPENHDEIAGAPIEPRFLRPESRNAQT